MRFEIFFNLCNKSNIEFVGYSRNFLCHASCRNISLYVLSVLFRNVYDNQRCEASFYIPLCALHCVAPLFAAILYHNPTTMAYVIFPYFGTFTKMLFFHKSNQRFQNFSVSKICSCNPNLSFEFRKVEERKS